MISGFTMASFQLQLFAAVVALALGAAHAAPGDPAPAVSTLWIRLHERDVHLPIPGYSPKALPTVSY